MTNTLLLVSISPSTSSKLCRLSLLLLLIVALMAFSTVVASPQSLESNQKFTQCIRLAEILSGEGINVSQQVELLNIAIVYLEANQTEAALPLLDEAYKQLSLRAIRCMKSHTNHIEVGCDLACLTRCDCKRVNMGQSS